MALIGLTGGIGSGKSTIAHELEQLGYEVYYSDTEAKRIICENPMVRSGIESLFGSEVFEGERYHTERVAREVFAHPELLERLNAIVHPAVRFDLEHKAKRTTSWLFVESAILYESGISDMCERVIAVVAEEQTRISRTLKRDYSGATDRDINKVRARIRAQMSEEELVRRADIVLRNDEGAEPKMLADQAIEELRALATRGDNSHHAE